ncbi:hypothetical protein N0V84_009018 [Fusarium piperis]|uniref:Serine protease n=1 Tax=Fusarium piperis TaxID=1435070 RepID=A0A9W9BKZ5_9HYPO|nr:hypothetical protein N0V84_009018 [Fusarium piperis]
MSIPSTDTTRAATWKLLQPETPHPVKSTLVPGDGNQGSDQSIFDPDMRVPVNPADFRDGGKYRSIVKIQSRFEDQRSDQSVWMMGTGWLVSPDLLVTAGHVVYDWSHRLGACTQMKCYIGYNGRDSVKSHQVQSRHGVDVVTTAEWVETDRNRTRDVAFVRLNRPFEGNLGTFRFETTPPSGDGINLGVVGYPGDRTLNDEFGAQMYAEFASTKYDLDESPRNLLDYQISAFGGQTGAPILRQDQGRLVPIGTHCYGDGDLCNSGTSIGNKHGNDYTSYINLLHSPSDFGSQVNIVEVPSKREGV